MGAEVPLTDEQQASAEQVVTLPQEPNTDASSEHVAPSPQPPNTEAGSSSSPPVPERLAGMLLSLGTSFRHVQNIPEFDPDQMIDWMCSSLASMDKVNI